MHDDNISKVFFKAIETYHDKMPFFDLTILNVTCKNIFKLPVRYCVLERFYPEIDFTSQDYWNFHYSYTDEELIEASNNPAIVHFAGFAVKIWKRDYNSIPEFYRQYMDLCPLYQKPILQESRSSTLSILRDKCITLGKKYTPKYIRSTLKNILHSYHSTKYSLSQNIVDTNLENKNKLSVLLIFAVKMISS